jgi:glutamate formiminotransferase
MRSRPRAARVREIIGQISFPVNHLRRHWTSPSALGVRDTDASVSLIECVPNVSEGRRPAVIEACVAAVRDAGAHVLDVSSDRAHNRTVLTLAGDAATLRDAVVQLAAATTATIDLRTHDGVHPCMGALDVVPFVPLGDTPLDACVHLARDTADALAARHGLPVFLYGAAARTPERYALEHVRGQGFADLAARMAHGWTPDAGPQAPHPSAGATAVGARDILIAYNVELATGDLSVARAVARAVRARDGGLPGVKALGLALADRGVVQVSMNLVDYRRTSMRAAFDAVADAAGRHGVQVVASELVGLAPRAALAPGDAEAIALRPAAASPFIEDRLATPPPSAA